MSVDADEVAWSIIVCSLAVAVVVSVVFGSYALYKVATTPNTITLCYVQSSETGGYQLKGNVEWGEDRRMGLFLTTEAAYAAAESIHCPLVGH